MGAFSSKTDLNEPLNHQNLTEREKADFRLKQKKKKRKARPRELTPNESRLILSKKKAKRVKKKKRLIGLKEDFLISKAKEEAPKENRNNLIFYWNHKSQSFDFANTLRSYKSKKRAEDMLTHDSEKNELISTLDIVQL